MKYLKDNGYFIIIMLIIGCNSKNNPARIAQAPGMIKEWLTMKGNGDMLHIVLNCGPDDHIYPFQGFAG
jgi:hypothetical protein